MIGETKGLWYDGPMLRANGFFILSKSAFTSSTLDVVCNATAKVLPAPWSKQINSVRNAEAGPALC
jgi:hypothetical protein